AGCENLVAVDHLHGVRRLDLGATDARTGDFDLLEFGGLAAAAGGRLRGCHAGRQCDAADTRHDRGVSGSAYEAFSAERQIELDGFLVPRVMLIHYRVLL